MNAVSPLGLSVQEGNGASVLAPSVALFAACGMDESFIPTLMICCLFIFVYF